jgi:hypothetical protein
LPGIDTGTDGVPNTVGATTAGAIIPGISTLGGTTIPRPVGAARPTEPSCGTTTDTGGTGADILAGGTGELDNEELSPKLRGLATPGGA